MSGVLSSTPFDLVDLFLYFQGLEVIELGFMRLKFCVELVLASLFLQTIWEWEQEKTKELYEKVNLREASRTKGRRRGTRRGQRV